jgi:hypothetical protein
LPQVAVHNSGFQQFQVAPATLLPFFIFYLVSEVNFSNAFSNKKIKILKNEWLSVEFEGPSKSGCDGMVPCLRANNKAIVLFHNHIGWLSDRPFTLSGLELANKLLLN